MTLTSSDQAVIDLVKASARTAQLILDFYCVDCRTKEVCPSHPDTAAGLRLNPRYAGKRLKAIAEAVVALQSIPHVF